MVASHAKPATITPTLNLGFGKNIVFVCTDPVTWCVKFTKSVSYWKCPASTVYGTLDLSADPY